MIVSKNPWYQVFFVTIAFILNMSCTKKQSPTPSSVSDATSPGEKKVFQYYRSSAHKTLDPMKQFDQASAEIVSNVYDTLLEYH